MHGDYLGGVYSITVDNGGAGEVTHGDHAVCYLHALLLNGKDTGINVVYAATVEGRSVHVDHQRLAGKLLGGDTGVVG